MPTTKELMKKNTKPIEDNYLLIKRLHRCEIRCTDLEKRVKILEELVIKLQDQIKVLQEIIENQQKQIDILRNQ